MDLLREPYSLGFGLRGHVGEDVRPFAFAGLQQCLIAWAGYNAAERRRPHRTFRPTG